MNSELMTGATPGAGYEMSESGWSNTDIFRKYLEDHVLPFVRPGDSTQLILLIVDGHASHTSPTLLKWAKSKNLVLFILPAHTSHLLQPLDVTLFGPFKVFYYAECAAYMKEHIGQVITRYEICRLACRAYLRSMTPLNIQAGLRKTGIFPFCKTAVPQEKLFPAEAFREKDPVAKIKAMKSGKEAVEEFLSNKSKEENIRFCESKEKLCHKCSCGAKIPKPKPGGRAVTEDNYLQEVDRYESSRDRADKENADTPMKKYRKAKKCLPFSTNINPSSPKPSTSGLNVTKTIVLDDSDTDCDSNIDEVCCVCKKWSPPTLNDYQEIKIINWAFCDKCKHCVHLTFCTHVRVIRRHDSFLCPCCQ